ncbi:MAG: type II secretion system protein [Chthoniobacteraceae bacterium]
MDTMPLRRFILPRAFTLIEILVVISIIAILMAMLFPALEKVREQARRAQARNDLGQILLAVKNYHGEYGKYPSVAAIAPDGDVLVGDADAKATIDNSALMDTLRAIGRGLNERHVLNPKRIIFLDGRTAGNAAEPRAGFSDKAESKKRGSFYDPWGRQYGVVMDADSDNTLTVAEQYSDFAGENAPRAGVGAFSMGKDGKLGTKGDALFGKGTTMSDDVISWQ